MKLPGILKNKYVLIFASVFAVLNVIGYATTQSWECMVLFAATAYSVNCYTKNVVLGILGGLFVANFVFGCGRVKENFQEGNTLKDNVMSQIRKAAKKEKTEGMKEGRSEEEANDLGVVKAAEKTAEKVSEIIHNGLNIISELTNNKEGLTCDPGFEPNEEGNKCVASTSSEGLKDLLSNSEGMKEALNQVLSQIKAN